MSLTMTVYGDKIDLADELIEEFHAQAKDAVSDAAEIWLDAIRRLLSLRQGTKQTASPEGEPPELDTGALARSFRKIPAQVRGNVAGSGIKSNDPGAARLEWGKTDVRGIRTLPHPYLLRSIAETRDEITALLRVRLS